MSHVIRTTTPTLVERLTRPMRAAYIRHRIASAERDIEHYSRTVQAWKLDVQSMRVELALLEPSHGPE